jgi:Zn-dependent protease with chaperone function
MKTRIEKFSIHQNAKVFALLMAVSSLLFVVPFMLIAALAAPKDAGFPLVMVVGFPVFYLVFGYLMIAVACWVYNTLVRYTGGIEFETRDVD